MPQHMSDAACELLGDFFTIFAHATRMRIFCALHGEPRTVTTIAAYAGVSITNASQHLRLMRDRGAVVAEKHAQSVYYRIADPRFVEAVMLIRASLLEGRERSTAQAAAPARRSRRTPNLQPA